MMNFIGLIITIIVIMKCGRASTIAEEVNAHLPDLQIASNNNPVGQFTRDFIQDERNERPQDGMEFDIEPMDTDMSPSEVIESHASRVTADDVDPSTASKRPRRKRRRRRRKRPKMTENSINISDQYFDVSTEQMKTHASYDEPEQTGSEQIKHFDDVQEYGHESLQHNENVVRRRFGKRRRRPLKRPVDNNYSAPNVEDEQNLNQEEIENASLEPNYDLKHESKPISFNENTKNPKINQHSKTESMKENDRGGTNKVEREFLQTEKEVEEAFNKLIIGEKRQRHPHQTKNGVNDRELITLHTKSQASAIEEPNAQLTEKLQTNTIPVLSIKNQSREGKKTENLIQYANKELISLEKHIQQRSKEPWKQTNDSKINIIESESAISLKAKHAPSTELENNQTKKTDNKKELFKPRRLPPISEILRQSKTKSELNAINEKSTNKNERKDIYSAITNTNVDEVTTARGLETNTYKKFLLSNRNESSRKVGNISKNQDDGNIENNSKNKGNDTEFKNHELEINFEFPIISYTGKKLSATSTEILNTSILPLSTIATTTITDNTTTSEIPYKTNITTICEYLSQSQNNKSSSDRMHHIILSDQEILKLISNFEATTTTEQIDIKPLKFEATNVPKINDEILTLLKTKSGSARLGKILQMRNMTLGELIEQRDRSTDLNIFANYFETVTNKQPSSDEHSMKYTQEESYSTPKLNTKNINIFEDILKEINDTYNNYAPETIYREPKRYENIPRRTSEDDTKIPFWKNSENNEQSSNFRGISQEIILSYTSSSENPTTTLDTIDRDVLLFNENDESSLFRNNIIRRKTVVESSKKKDREYYDKRRLPVGIKTAIIISGAIFALAVLGFFALLLSCKIRQKKSKLRRQQDILCSRYKNREMRQSSRSTSPVVKEPKYHSEHLYPNIPSNASTNRHYYLWKTIRKTFQYD